MSLLPEEHIGLAILLAWIQSVGDKPTRASVLYASAVGPIERLYPGTRDEVRERWVRAMFWLSERCFIGRSGTSERLVLAITDLGRAFVESVEDEYPDLAHTPERN